MVGHGLDRAGSKYVKLAGFYECGNECLGFIKCGEIVD
jgi:hypothetical protein